MTVTGLEDCRELKSDNLPNDVNGILIELNLRKVKWLFFSTYHLHSQSEDYYFAHVSNFLDAFSSTYDWLSLVGNSNTEDSKETLFKFLKKYNAANIVNDKTCFKSLDNPSCIDLFITSQCF